MLHLRLVLPNERGKPLQRPLGAGEGLAGEGLGASVRCVVLGCALHDYDAAVAYGLSNDGVVEAGIRFISRETRRPLEDKIWYFSCAAL